MEYRKLPPQDPEAADRWRKVMKDVAVIRAEILARRGGIPLDVCEIDEALREVRAGE